MAHGIYSYTCYLTKESANGPWTEKTPKITSEKNFTGTDSGLTAGTHYWFKYIIRDKAGNEGTVTGDAWTKANAPSITIANNTAWTKEKIATIKAAPTGHTIRYTTNGTAPTATTGIEIAGTGDKTVKLTTNCTIKAIYVNTSTKAISGVGSATTTLIDETIPTTASISVTSKTSNSITVKATGADTISGVYMYTFQLSTTSSTSGFGNSKSYQVSTGTCTHTFEQLTSVTTYYLKVIVVDRAGNLLESTVVNTATYYPAPLIECLGVNRSNNPPTIKYRLTAENYCTTGSMFYVSLNSISGKKASFYLKSYRRTSSESYIDIKSNERTVG